MGGGITMTQLPLVSVIIDNYNYGNFVREAINSALDQTYPNVEVIVVDDGSTDNSREVISSFGDRIITILKENGGQASAFNAGFTASRGEWIHLLDSDDLFNTNKVQRIYELAAEYPMAGMIAHDLDYCNAEGELLNFAPPYIKKRRLVDDRRQARRGKLSASLPATSGLSIRRDVLTCVLPMPSEIRIGADNYLKWVILSLCPVLKVPEFQARQRIHGRNAGTVVCEAGGTEARIRLATQSAQVVFHMKKEHPHLAKLAWKLYGRILYGLRSCKSEEAREIENDIRAHYSVVERTPSCFFYVAASFAKAFLEDILSKDRKRRNA